MLNFYPFKNPIGLDISDLVIRVVQLRTSKVPEIVSLNEMALPEGLIVEGEIQDQRQVSKMIRGLIANALGDKIKTHYCVFALPERKSFIKVIQIPGVNQNNLAEAVKWEMTKHVPYALDEVYLDWQKIRSPGPTELIDIIIAVAPKNIVDIYLQTLEMAGLMPIAVETESTAVSRCILRRNETNQSLMIVDIGGSRTNLIMYDKNTIQFTLSIPFSGRYLTRKISENQKLSMVEAEKAKMICGLDPKKGKGKIKKMLEPIIENDLIKKISESLEYYQNHFQNITPCRKIVLAGGGGKLIGLNELITGQLKLKTESADPLVNINKVQYIKSNKDYLAFTTAIGLALREIYYHDYH
jgi:type IV pilus assembly protein PilM